MINMSLCCAAVSGIERSLINTIIGFRSSAILCAVLHS